jgi:hypothetical protein
MNLDRAIETLDKLISVIKINEDGNYIIQVSEARLIANVVELLAEMEEERDSIQESYDNFVEEYEDEIHQFQ